MELNIRSEEAWALLSIGAPRYDIDLYQDIKFVC